MHEEEAGDAPALFDVPAGPTPAGGVGRAETHLEKSLVHASWLTDKDAALVGGARVAARALDSAERIGGLKGGYLVAQLLRPYQDALEPLGLAGVVTGPAAPAAGGEPAGGGVPDGVPEWWGQEFGTPS